MTANKSLRMHPALPAGWRWAKLGEVCEIIAGQSPPGDTYRKAPEGLPFYQGKADFGPRHPITRIWCVAPKKIACANDILISVRAPVGPTNVANEDCCIGRGLAALRCSTNLDMDFLLFWLKKEESQLERKGSGSTFGAINRKDLEDFMVPFLPLSEQKRIVAILNEQMAAIEKARAAAEAQLEAARALPAAYLTCVFPEKGKALPPGWRFIRLGERVIKIGSGLTPLGGHASYTKTGIPLIRSQNVHNNFFEKDGLAFISKEQDDAMANSRVIENDVLLNITGASIGRVCVVPSEVCPANVNQHVSIIRCDNELSPRYLSYFISTPAFQKFIMETQAGATRQALTKSLIQDFVIPAPSVIEQECIVTALNAEFKATQELQKSLEKKLAEIKALPAALLRRAFKGEL